MDDLIIRSLQGRTSRLEEDRLTAWRRASLSNERRYRDLVKVWRITEAATPVRVPPSPATLLELATERRDRRGEDAAPGADPLVRRRTLARVRITPAPIAPRPPPELVQRFRNLRVTAAADAVGVANVVDGAIRPIRVPISMVGTAVTVRLVDGDALAVHAAIHLAEAGDVLVVDAGGSVASAVWDQLATVAAQKQGLAGVVIDGAARDHRDLRDAAFAVFCRGFTAAGPQLDAGGSVNSPVHCGGVRVRPGDVILGDDDGVVVVPRDEAEKVLQQMEARLLQEEERMTRVRAGESSLDVLGLRQRI